MKRHLISAVGQLHHPSIPKFVNASQFEGAQFHTTEWNYDVDLSGKTVAVIGNAATAVQFIPAIAKKVKKFWVFQRSPNWVLPKLDRPYTKFEQWLSDKFPVITKMYRLSLWLRGEFILFPAIKDSSFARWILSKLNQWMMKKSIKDPETIKTLIPDYPVGAKRILCANNFYASLARDNVELVTLGVKEFSKNGIIDVIGKEHDCDVVIYSTGFKTNPFLAPMNITGLDELGLSQHWKNGAEAYLGVQTSGFPNLHIMYGPNTKVGIWIKEKSPIIGLGVQGSI